MSIAYVISTLRRRWLTALLFLLVGALAGAIFAQATPDRYAATASLVVTPVVSNPMTGNREEVNIRTEQEILGSRAVSSRAAESLDLDEDNSSVLRADIEVAAPSGSQILQVTVQADTPEQAADGANAIASSYLDMRRETTTDATERYIESVDQQIEDLRTEPPTEATEALIERLQQQRSSVGLTDLEPGQIIGSATPPTAPSGPGLLITAAGGAMAGLLSGVAAAVLRERLDHRVRSADRLQLATGPLPVVATKSSDEQFWMRLADETLRHSRVDTANSTVRVLLHTVAPIPYREAAEDLLKAARWILSDPGGAAELSDRDADVDQAPNSARSNVAVVPSGRYRSSLSQSARRSDIAVIMANPRTPLRDVTELVRALQECDLAVVVGIAEEPLVSVPPTEQYEDQSAPKNRHRALKTEHRELTATPGIR